ncbi:MAG TPA: sigma-70 family RNA polymerase sigma factor [Pyrinomonadaceae bacterium]|nr:sigma-70 family RNA polymerase sigma factor [Pyrinomonadaceae bacterium]
MAQTILNRIADGDKTAVEECLDKFGGLVWSLARRMCPNTDDAEDAVQEIFIDVWKNAARFDEVQASEATFIAMIARRRLIDRLRKNQRQPNVDSFEDILVEPSKNSNEMMQTSIEAKQAAEALKHLRPEQRQILQLSIVQGFSHQEIANALDMPLGTVKTHARRGILQVREVLGLESSGMAKEVKA